MKILVFPIDKNGFIRWESERYRFVDAMSITEKENGEIIEIPFEPLPDEIITPIPQNVLFFQPRWDGKQWVEGKDHPGLPVQEINEEE